MAADDYSRALARAAVGQLAELAGYESVQESSTEVLSELLIKYISELSRAAHSYAELANRSAVNVHDLLLSLDDLGTSVPELQTYLSALQPEDNTFTHAITGYPIRRPARMLPTWQDKHEQPPPHIPAFLPAFPDKHTYQSTPAFAGHEPNPDKQAKALQKARKQAEASLLKLHHATASAAKATSQKGGEASAGKPGHAAGEASAAAPLHPFLEPPAITVVNVGSAHGREADGVHGGGVHPAGLGAYEPQAASQAFGLVPDAAQPTDADGEELMPPEELVWKYQTRMDKDGELLRPLATSADYAAGTAAAQHTYVVGRVEGDAFEEAAKEAAVHNPAGGGATRKRKSVYATVTDPVRRKAGEILDTARNPNAGGEGDDVA